MWTADRGLNMKAIFAVMNTTWAVVKIRPKKFRPVRGRIWTHDLYDTGSSPVQAWIFSGFNLTTAQVVFITAKIVLIFVVVVVVVKLLKLFLLDSRCRWLHWFVHLGRTISVKTFPFVFRVSIWLGQLGFTDSLFVPSASGGWRSKFC